MNLFIWKLNRKIKRSSDLRNKKFEIFTKSKNLNFSELNRRSEVHSMPLTKMQCMYLIFDINYLTAPEFL